MYNDIEDLRKELECLCEDYIEVLSHLKYNGIDWVPTLKENIRTT